MQVTLLKKFPYSKRLTLVHGIVDNIAPNQDQCLTKE